MQENSGNVLFLILVAVALFAALSYAVTQSTRAGGGSADKEKLTTDSAAIIQYPVSLQTAVTRQMIGNGTDATSLLFDAPASFGGMTAAQLARQAFHPTGGGAVYQSCDGVRDIGRSGAVLNANQDIIATRPVSKEICQTINTRLGITSALPQMYTTYQYSPQMTLAFPGICNGGTGGEITQAEFRGKHQGCYQDGDWGYLYYHVLVPR